MAGRRMSEDDARETIAELLEQMSEDDADLLASMTSGDRGEALAAIRDVLARNLIVADVQTAAATAKQLVATLDAIEATVPPEESEVDDLEARRAARRATDLPEASAVGDERRTRGSRSRG